jgi:hypothetical protein
MAKIGVLTGNEESWDRKYGIESLTDRLLSGVYGDPRMKELREAERAARAENFLEHRIGRMGEGNILSHSNPTFLTMEGQYVLPELGIEEMTAIGVAMAMLILSTMQNEVTLDTQIEGVKGTQNQKLSASITKMQKLRERIKKARRKTRFQKFMAWLMDTWLMKFLNSNYGKVIMFIIGAAATIASLGTAGPAMIAISCAFLGMQLVEMVLGKSMGELITQGMPDGAAKMALQMSIDMALMVAQMATGGGGQTASKAVESVDTATDMAQTAAKTAQTAAKGAETAAQAAETVQTAAKVADLAADTAVDAVKVVDTATDAVRATETAAKVVETAQEGSRIMETAQEVGKAVDIAEDAAKAADVVGDTAKAADVVGDTAEVGRKNFEYATRLVLELNKAKQRVEVGLQLISSMNNFAKSEEQANQIRYAAEIEAINVEWEAQDAFYQTIIDHQLSDIEVQISYAKASFARAAEVIREQGEVSRMIAQNLVI